jgi:hypothetical protein
VRYTHKLSTGGGDAAVDKMRRSRSSSSGGGGGGSSSRRAVDSGSDRFFNFKFSTVVVDPPRAGLDDVTRAALAVFPTIVYV